MVYNLVVKEEAEADALEAYLYYEDKQVGLGKRFIESLSNKYKKLATNPHLYSILKAGKKHIYCDVKVEHFPYVIIYEIIGSDVLIYAIFNTYKKPLKRFKSK